MTITIHIEENEKWFGAHTWRGKEQPYDKNSNTTLDAKDCQGNQLQPIMLSSHGRYFYCQKGFVAKFDNGVLTVDSPDADIHLQEGLGTLRGAFLHAKDNYFPAGGVMPPDEFFTAPQFNTWIELMYDQNQEDILCYAKNIVEHGFKPGILMVDDLWNCDYGKWDFDPAKFSDPKLMMDTLHDLGFKLILWICPFVSPDSVQFRHLMSKGGLIRDPMTKEPRMVRWWNGFSALLDLTNPVDVEWITEQCDRLIEKYGVDGFKFDAGDTSSYREDDLTYSPVLPIEQTKLWAQFGTRYAYNELRACYMCSDTPTVTRLGDKSHSWGNHGLADIIPNTLAQATSGYCFTCPDMVGGGMFSDFLPGATTFDPELFLRYTSASALLPMIQFSAAPWRVLSDKDLSFVKALMAQREEYLPQIMELVRASATTGEPAIRRLEYVFPHEDLADVTDQFMLGDVLLVAPCLEKGRTEREVRLPKGRWRAENGTEYEGGTTVTIPAPLDRVPVLKKI